jgi:glutamyl-tRNA synthetase
VIRKFGFDENDVRSSQHYCEQAVALLKDRVQFESEFTVTGNYLFVAPDSYDDKVIAKRWNEAAKLFFDALLKKYTSLENFTAEACKATFESTAAENNLKPGDVLQLCRVLVSGAGSGVDLFGMHALFGKDETMRRIQVALTKI